METSYGEDKNMLLHYTTWCKIFRFNVKKRQQFVKTLIDNNEAYQYPVLNNLVSYPKNVF